MIFISFILGKFMHKNLRLLVEKILAKKPKKVLIQLPPGLIVKANEIIDVLKEKGIEGFVSLEPCFGACDLRDNEAEKLGCDLLVHVGHSDLGLSTAVPVLYYEWFTNVDPIPILVKGLRQLDGYEKIGLIASVNFVHVLDKVIDFLVKKGKKPFVSGNGQILGCDLRAAMKVEKNVDCFLFIGSGRFHPLGLAMKTKKPVFVLEVEKGEIKRLNPDLFIRQRLTAIALAKGAKNFGILLSTKPGQLALKKVANVKQMLEKAGKKVWTFVLDEVKEEKLLGLDIECWVNCACPRIALDDRLKFKKPILNPDELKEALK
jgi:2-(3-amino-3-carboxypropyl)histidine synthase